MHAAKGQGTDEGIEHLQRSLITVQTAFVLILRKELGGCFAKRVLALLTEKMRRSGLRHASRQQRLGLGTITGAAALADALAINDFVDVPDTTAKEKARRSSLDRRHDDGR
jgi:hypothetical protein